MSFPSDSVGLVTPQKFQFEQPLELECGRILPRFDLMVETYGTLNADKSNAILICHALSGIIMLRVIIMQMIKKQVGGIAVLVPEKRLIPIIFLLFL